MSEHNAPIIAVVGATGAVGREALSILAERGHPAERVVALASDRSAGSEVAYADGALRVSALSHDAIARADAAIFAASSAVSREFAPPAARAGVVCVDNSSAFRMAPDIPLVIPEVNGSVLEGRGHRLVANPNCSTILLLVGIEPIRREFGIEDLVVSTYQAVSGAGLPGLLELEEQARAFARESPLVRSVFPQQTLFNCFIHESEIEPDTGMNAEERKMIEETGKVWGLAHAAPITPTCVRVPVLRAHSESVTLRLGRPARVEDLRAALRAGEGVRLVDDPSVGAFPTPLEATGRDEVLVGRVRRARPGRGSADDGTSTEFTLWLCGDQIRKGAALNAIQIAERLLPGLLRPGNAPGQRAGPASPGANPGA